MNLVIIGLIAAVLILVFCTIKLKLHPFFALIATSAVFAIISGMNMEQMLKGFASGLGGTVADIGLVIALGTVTGVLLENRVPLKRWLRPSSKLRVKNMQRLDLPLRATSFPSLYSAIPPLFS